MKKFAMLFPGQGSQSVGMISDLASKYAEITDIFKQASEVLGYDLWKLVDQGPTEELNQTWKTQPALLTTSYSIYRLWNKLYPNYTPSFMAGHSLGEYSALVCANVIDFHQALTLVELRGKLMQSAVAAGEGSMYAILGLDNESIITACEEASQGQIVSAVNFNCPGQVVIAGTKLAVERAVEICKKKGAKRALPLNVSVPSHCALMEPASKKLEIELKKIKFNKPSTPIINNVDVTINYDEFSIKEALVKQLYSPVRWTETIEFLNAEKVSLVYEIGPNKVLVGLNKKIVDMEALAINTISTLEEISLS